MKWKILTDTGSNLREISNLPENIEFDLIPLILHVDKKDYVDTPSIDVADLIESVKASKSSSSACPAPGAYAEKFAGAENVICFTISSELSGSYNSAELGKSIALEQNPDANIYIFNTRTAGGEMDLLAKKAVELIQEGKDFDGVIAGLNAYHKNTHTGYMLKSIQNLVKNGRVSKVVGSVVGLLNIHIIGIRSEEGTIEMSGRARGEKKALKTLLKDIVDNGYSGNKLEIAHVLNRETAETFANQVREKFPKADITISPTSGLCSFYAEMGGLMVGYEKN